MWIITFNGITNKYTKATYMQLTIWLSQAYWLSCQFVYINSSNLKNVVIVKRNILCSKN